MTDQRIELMLHELATEIDYPPTPDLSTGVTIRLVHDPLSPVPRMRPRWLRPALAAAAIVVGVAFTLAFSPAARRADADLLGVVGIQISIGQVDTDGVRGTDLSDLELGERVSPARAEDLVGFDVRGTHALMGPAHTYVDRSVGETGMVSTVFYAPGRPRRAEYLITEFRASLEEGFFKKVSPTEGRVRFAPVGNNVGYWLAGDPHLFYYVDDSGAFREEAVRLAGNVLLWEEAGITYRIEGASFLGEAQNIAAVMRAGEPKLGS